MTRDVVQKWFEARDVDERRLLQIARLAELGLSVAATAHDLRQPLSALKMTLQILRERTSLPTDTAQDLDEALRQVARVETLVERTRNMFAPPQGMASVDLVTLAEAIAGAAKWPARHDRSASLEVETGRDIPTVAGDRSLLEQLVMNLVNNARDAVEEHGGGRVLLIVRRDAVGDSVELIVADDGPGISSESAERVFEPFFTTKAQGKGTGLGLYIVRRVAEDHGAKLELMSAKELAALGRGALSTGFRVAFPIAARAKDADAKQVAALPSAPPPTGGRRALVVEDEPIVRRLIVKLLEREGFECVPCATGDEALAALTGDAVDLVVADKNLPGASGLEVLKRARRRSRATRAVITTGYPSESSVLEAMALDVDDYFLKPLDVEALRGRIRGLFEAPTGEGADAPDGPAPDDRRVLVAEADMTARRAIEVALRGLGREVETHAAGPDLDAALSRSTARFLIGRPEVLRRARRWLARRDRDATRFGLAVIEREGVEAAIEAIQAGARGVLAPPFTAGAVREAFERLRSCVEDECGRGGRP